VVDICTLDMDFISVRAAIACGLDPVEIIAESYRRTAAAQAGNFTTLVPAEIALDNARAVRQRAQDGLKQPLLGLTFCVKDNLHIAGMATTANCPGLSIMPQESAAAVLALEAAGAVLVGKNTLDQFATGLNGTRSPEPLCRNAIDPAFIPGGSSSGSAVAVAKNLVAFSLGSDTGGSGRVPAACNGIVGLKPTIGLVSGRGLLYNNRLLDCISIFARTCADANEILGVIAGYDPLDPNSRESGPTGALPTGTEQQDIAVVRADQLDFEGDRSSESAYMANLDQLRGLGFALIEIDFEPFSEAGRLVFQSALVAERLIDYGAVVANRPDTVHPIVRAAIETGLAFSALDAFGAISKMTEARRYARETLRPFAAFVVPTVPTIYTIAAMLAEPVSRNTAMGHYTYFVNPMDLCAVAVPGASRNDGLPSSLSFIGLPGRDAATIALAQRFEASRVATIQDA
jgi:allophanate hydrolase